MINCKGCNFTVTKDMRFAMMKNICPGCGQALFGDSELQEIIDIKSKILGQDFSHGLSDQIIHDMALFIFREVESLLPELKPKQEQRIVVGEVGEIKEETQEEIAARIREEVENELADEIDALSNSEDEDHKIARLKRVYKDSKIKRSGVVVSRLNTEEL